MTIGENLKILRKKSGLSQDKLSKLANLSLHTVAHLEYQNCSNCNVETLQKLAKALNVSATDFLK